MRLALALVVAVVGTGTPMSADVPRLHDPWARVRPANKRVETLLSAGMAGSATFRDLVRRVEASDVIVYVEVRRGLRAGTGASTSFVAASATHRYLRVRLSADLTRDVQVALLGHELQHVVEVAGAPGVRSPETLRDFYRRSGLRTGPDSYDSVAARQAGYQVRAELRQQPSGDLRLARRAGPDDDAVLDGGSIDDLGAGAPGTR